MKTKKSTPQTYSEGLVKDSFASVLAHHFPLTVAPNATTCDPLTILNLLLDATLNNRTVTASLNILGQQDPTLPDSDSVFRQLKKLTVPNVQNWYNTVNAWTIHQIRARAALRAPVLVAIDEHRRPYYGKEDQLTTRGQHKQGTNKAHAVLSAEVLDPDMRLTLSTVPVPRLAHRQANLEKLLNNVEIHRIYILAYLLDRGFFGVETIQTIERHESKYLMGRPATKRIKRLWQENSRDAVCIRNTIEEHEEVLVIPNHVVKGTSGSIETTLIIARRTTGEDTQINAWVTNIPCTIQSVKTLLSTYRSRWGIETGYRCKKEARAKTTASNPALRLAILLLSFLLYNLWRLAQWAARDRDGYGITLPLYYYVFRHDAHSRLCRRLVVTRAAV